MLTKAEAKRALKNARAEAKKFGVPLTHTVGGKRVWKTEKRLEKDIEKKMERDFDNMEKRIRNLKRKLRLGQFPPLSQTVMLWQHIDKYFKMYYPKKSRKWILTYGLEADFPNLGLDRNNSKVMLFLKRTSSILNSELLNRLKNRA